MLILAYAHAYTHTHTHTYASHTHTHTHTYASHTHTHTHLITHQDANIKALLDRLGSVAFTIAGDNTELNWLIAQVIVQFSNRRHCIVHYFSPVLLECNCHDTLLNNTPLYLLLLLL